jgi:hypothetical protein
VLEARRLDRQILEAWHGHPRLFVVQSAMDFLDKARTTMELIRNELPECCRKHAIRELEVTSKEAPVADHT